MNNKKEYQRLYRLSHKEKQKEYQKAYYLSHKEVFKVNKVGRAPQIKDWRIRNRDNLKKYRRQYYLDNIEYFKNYAKQYCVDNKVEIRLTQKKYEQSPKGRECMLKKQAKRKRNLGFVPLNVSFMGSNGHHVDINRVIYISESLHRSVRHNVFTGYNMDKINKIAFDFLEGDN